MPFAVVAIALIEPGRRLLLKAVATSVEGLFISRKKAVHAGLTAKAFSPAFLPLNDKNMLDTPISPTIVLFIFGAIFCIAGAAIAAIVVGNYKDRNNR